MCPCHWNISAENILLSSTLSSAYWPPVTSDNPLLLFCLTVGQDDHLLHSLVWHQGPHMCTRKLADFGNLVEYK